MTLRHLLATLTIGILASSLVTFLLVRPSEERRFPVMRHASENILYEGSKGHEREAFSLDAGVRMREELRSLRETVEELKLASEGSPEKEDSGVDSERVAPAASDPALAAEEREVAFYQTNPSSTWSVQIHSVLNEQLAELPGMKEIECRSQACRLKVQHEDEDALRNFSHGISFNPAMAGLQIDFYTDQNNGQIVFISASTETVAPEDR